MSAKINLTGRRFGALTAICAVKVSGKRKWICDCDCGNRITTSISNLRVAKSCGCKKKTRIGLSNTPTGKSWQAMITRCYNSKQRTYAAYGAVGVKVCEFLRCGPTNLIALIGARPKGKTVDRKNNLGMYSCGTCAECLSRDWLLNIRWATKVEQNRNQKDLHYIQIDGVTKCVSEWALEFGIKRTTVCSRIRYGWTGKRLFSPVK